MPDPLPSWAINAMQGLAFWIGHRRAQYGDHPLVEGALVAETCNLVQGKLETGNFLLCERQYSTLASNVAENDAWPTKARADLVVVKAKTRADANALTTLAQNVVAVAEFKRAFASAPLINSDLQRLAALKHCNPSLRALLFLAAEGQRPKKYVTEEGTAVRGRNEITSASAAYYTVRRVCKATASFGGHETAHYVVCLEVFAR